MSLFFGIILFVVGNNKLLLFLMFYCYYLPLKVLPPPVASSSFEFILCKIIKLFKQQCIYSSMGNPRRALKFAMISSACLSKSFMVLGIGLGTSARSLMKGEASLGAGIIAGRDGRAPGALFAVSFLPCEPSGL